MILSLLPILLFFSFVFQLDYRPSSSLPLQILPSHPDGPQASSLHAFPLFQAMESFPSLNVHCPSVLGALPWMVKGFLPFEDVGKHFNISNLPPPRLAGLVCPFCCFISCMNFMLHREEINVAIKMHLDCFNPVLEFGY